MRIRALSIFANALLLSGCDIFLPKAGYLDQACLPQDQCMLGLECVQKKCVPTGTDGFYCHRDGTCDDEAACFSGTCYTSGLEGQACRDELCIDPRLRCFSGTCALAATIGQACAAEDDCADGLRCLELVCVAAGGLAEPCRADGTCTDELECLAGVCTVVGGESGPCRADGTCDAEDLRCIDEVCVKVGEEGLPCKSDGTCDIGLACHAGVCAALASRVLELPHGGQPVYSVCFHPDGERLVTAGGDGYGRIWSYRDGALIAALTGHTAAIRDLSISANGALIATASDDRTARVWSSDGTQVKIYNDFYDYVTSTSFTQETIPKVAFATSGGTIRMYHTVSWFQETLPTGTGSLRTARFAPNGDLAVGYANGTTTLWRAPSYPSPVSLERHASAVNRAAFSHDGALVATGSADGTVKISEAISATPLYTIATMSTGVLDVAFSPDDSWLAATGADGTIRLFMVLDGALVATYRHRAAVYAVAFSHDGALLAGGDLFDVVLWEVPAI